jgi:hypothetical protein
MAARLKIEDLEVTTFQTTSSAEPQTTAGGMSDLGECSCFGTCDWCGSDRAAGA